MAACSWNSIPNELKLHTIGFLMPECVKTLSKVSCDAYALCVPTLFKVRFQLAPAICAQLTNSRHTEHHAEQL